MAFFIFSQSYSNAQGSLLVTPKRVVFEGNKKAEELNLANVGKDSATFIISFVQIRMKEDGMFEQIAEPDSGQYFADKYLRVFPRTVTLAPNEAQTVKVQLRRVNELTPGEYRSHLYFRAVPVEKPLGDKEEPKKDSSISVKLVPIFGITTPVIIRMGESTAKVNISNVSLVMANDTTPVLNATFNRSGNMSVYGDFSVDHISAEGKVTKVAMIRGISVYTPNLIRNFHIALDKASGVNYHSGKLQLTYSDQSATALKLAEATLDLH